MIFFGQQRSHGDITWQLMTVVFVVEIKCTSASECPPACPEKTSCCGDKCCPQGGFTKTSTHNHLNFSETWYFWVGIVASVLMFLGFLTLCICYLKRSLAVTLSLVQSIPNDMVIIRTVQDPNGIIRPEVTRYANQPRLGKAPPQDASQPEETNDSMLPLDPAYPPVRAVRNSSGTRERNNQNLADIILPPGYVLQQPTHPD